MKWRYQSILLATVGLAGIYFIGKFAISDFVYHDAEALKEKPWRPFARLVFGAVMIPLFLGFLFLYTKIASRNRGD